MSDRGWPRVVMLVQNDWRHDTRVIREAHALARRAFDVHVVCRVEARTRSVEHVDGVVYHCLPLSLPPRPREVMRLLRQHLIVIRMSLEAGRDNSVRDRVGVAMTALSSLGLAVLFPLALPLLLLRRLQKRAPRALGERSLERTESLMRRIGLRLQPFRYLNDFGLQGLAEVMALKPSVIHAHDLVTLSTGARASRALSCKLVYDAHELETHTNYHSLTPATKRWIGRYERFLVRRTDRVITVCESIADWLEREYPIERPLVVMNAPASLPLTDGVARASGVRAELGLPPDVPLAVYVGSVTIDRGLELCVDALRHLDGVHLATVGPRNAETESAMRREAERVAVEERLHFVDPRPAHEVVPFIASADCSVMAIQNICLSYYLCFPNKLLESVYARLPVVVADLLELRRFVDRYHVGTVVDETSAEAIAAGIRAVLGSDEYRPSRDALETIARGFGWPEQERRLVALYGRLRDPTGRVT